MNKKSNKKQSVREFNLGRFKNMVIVALVAVIIGATAAFTMIVQDLKKQTITSEQATYLTVFDELAENFAQNLDISDKGRTVAEMTGYGVSDEDGAFYIKFDFMVVDDEGQVVQEKSSGKVYFWYDEGRNNYSYAFSYE